MKPLAAALALTPDDVSKLAAQGIRVHRPDAPEAKPVRVTPPGPCSRRPPLGKRQEASGAALEAILARAEALPYHGKAVPLMRLAVEANMPMARFREECRKRKAAK